MYVFFFFSFVHRTVDTFTETLSDDLQTTSDTTADIYRNAPFSAQGANGTIRR